MKLWIDRVLDLLLWIFLCLMLATGFILRYRLPPGSRGGAGRSIWDWSRHDWGDLHARFGCAVCIMVAIHLGFHWPWLWRCAVPRRKWPLFVGLLLGVLLALSAWILPVERASRAGRGGDGERLGRGQDAGWRSGR